MSGGSQHPFPFHTQNSNPHDASYPSYPSASSNQSPPFYAQHSGVYSNHPQHGSASPYPAATDQFGFGNHQPAFPHNLNAQSGHHHPNNHNQQPDFSSHQQYGYPASSAAFAPNFANFAPDLNAGGAHLSGSPSFPQPTSSSTNHLQPGQWNQQQGLSPASFDGSFHSPLHSHSPQPISHPYENQPGLPLDQYQQQSPYVLAAQPSPAVPHQPKIEADFDSVSIPPPPHIDSASSSPQKPAFRIKLKRSVKTHETSSGGQQAQAQLQIDPSPVTNMVFGRPSRNAAAAASANIHSSFSVSPVNRAPRGRQIKQQPGSDEEFEEVSESLPTESHRASKHGHEDNNDVDEDDDNDDDEEGGGEGEKEVEEVERNDVQGYEQDGQSRAALPRRSSRTRTNPPSAQQSQQAQQAQPQTRTKSINVKPLKAAKQKASSRGNGSRASTSGSRSASRTPIRTPKRGLSRTPSDPVRRSTRLSRESQPPWDHDIGFVPAPPQNSGRSFELVDETLRQQLDADEHDDEDEDAEADSDEDAEGEQKSRVKAEVHDEEPEPILSTSRSGRVRRQRVTNMAESEDSDAVDDEDEEAVGPRRSSRRLQSNALDGFVAADDDEEEDDEGEYGSKRATRSSGRLQRGGNGGNNRLVEMAAKKRAANGRGRPPKRKPRDEEYEMEGEETPEEEQISGAEDDPLDIHSDEPEGSQGKSYSLRQRKKVNYSLVPPPPSPPRDGFGRPIKNNRGRSANGAYELDPSGGDPASGTPGAGLPMPFPGRGKKGKEGWDALPSSMTGKDYARIFGDPVDSSDEEMQNNAMRKPGAPAALGGGPAGGLLGGAGGAGGPPGGLTGAGGTDSFGRIKKSGDPLADIDPLGVDMNIDFDSVGGLDGHIQQLKEMVMLPLLYPEVFQRFKVTPPRGVLFHGPPGTGKTLVARALAASCSTEGQQVSFFMRKGADCLSKWVGEAERQLRLLFEEARNSQPSIIFFDEIDGLAPVRSSKQDQIHASIVSTMLALMDGMDGRGQVVVIGATNRPDSVDPALRRPGRFDREFYFPLPSLEARKSIINIHTKKWEPPLDDDFKARLAEVTKGYGGADLRALCTEAALNAIQRRYPQIYSTTDRLLLDPASIQVDAKDFMMSVNKIVPSSARASASAAAPLPERLTPLLGHVVQDAISVLDRILPPVSKRNPLEEALWEDDAFAPQGLTSGLSAADKLGGDRGFGREMLLQSFEAQRVYRPRMLVHGDVGMGQGAVGAALLQHLEGYHVQSLDIGTLLGDSARTPEAAIIQLFVEAKRHKPSVLYIPGIVHWSRSVSESVKTTFKALLDGLTDADPVMLLGIAEAPLDELDDEVHSWFNFLDDDIVEISRPDDESRRGFFKEIFDHIIRPPTEFPDALPRRKKVLEDLPKAPPRPPRKLTQAELQQQVENDNKLLEHLKYRLGPVLAELRKKFKKFTRDVWDEYNLRELTQAFEWKREKGKITVELRYYEPGAAARLAAEAAAAEEAADDQTMLETEADIAAKRGITAAQFMGPPAATISEIAAEETGEIANGGEAVSAGDVEMINGDAAANGAIVNGTTNGVHVAGEADGQAATAIQPPTFEDNEVVAADAVDAAASAATAADPLSSSALADTSIASAAAAANGTSGDDPDYRTRTMPIWTMNLEKMQKHLYYGNYRSCSAFLADIQKIVDNAEQAAEVDRDRLFRAHQMRNLAIVLMDQYIDAGFREECDRMALRQMARDQEADEATEKAKQSASEAAAKKAEGTKGERTSARIAGKEPELAGGLENADRSTNKRQRSTSAQMASADAEKAPEQSDAMVEDDEARKRARLASPSSTTNNPNAADATSASSLPTSLAPIKPVEPQPQPEVAHPPLVYTATSYENLKNYIITSSARYNIDQLSRLRAACFNAIWSHRSDWDRDALIGRLIEITKKSEDAVRRESGKFQVGV